MTKKQLTFIVIIMLVASILVSAGTVFGGLWYMKKSSSNQSAEDWLADSPLAFLTEDNSAPQPPSYHSLEKVVLSVKGKQQNHFVMMELAIETRTPERIANINEYMPVVENSLIKLFSDKTYEDLQLDGAVDHLQQEVKQTILTAFDKTPLVRHIDDVLLTKYVVQ